MQVALHLTSVGRKANAWIDIADIADGVADQLVDDGPVEGRAGGNLTRNHREISRDHGFASHPAMRIMLEAVVKHGVANLVSHFVGMAHGNRFAGEQVTITHGKLLKPDGTRRSNPYRGQACHSVYFNPYEFSESPEKLPPVQT